MHRFLYTYDHPSLFPFHAAYRLSHAAAAL